MKVSTFEYFIISILRQWQSSVGGCYCKMVCSVFNIHFGEIALIPSAYFGQCSAHMATTTHSIECNGTHSCCTLILCPHPIDNLKKLSAFYWMQKMLWYKILVENKKKNSTKSSADGFQFQKCTNCIEIKSIAQLGQKHLNFVCFFLVCCELYSISWQKCLHLALNCLFYFFQLKKISIMSILDSTAPTFSITKKGQMVTIKIWYFPNYNGVLFALNA